MQSYKELEGEMETIPYQGWLHWFVTMRCNLNCDYCFKNPIKKTAQLRPINITKVINTLEKTDQIFRIGLTGGGEPFLVPNINEFCAELTKKHYLTINTNLTTSKIEEFAKVVNPDKVIIVHASLHLEELFKKKLVNQFIENYQILRSKQINLEVKAVAYPGILSKVSEYKDFFRKNAIEFEFEPFIGNYHQKIYPDRYTEDELAIFGMKPENKNIFFQKGKKCNAGYNVGIVLPNGNIYSCFQVSKNLGNINEEIKLSNYLVRCPGKKCECPLNFYDKVLFQQALSDQEVVVKKPNAFINYAGLILMNRDFIRNEY